jgi:hypothetical protein
MENGTVEVGAAILLRIAQQCGKSIEWLLTGHREQGARKRKANPILIHGSIFCRFSAADWIICSESSLDESCLYSDSYGQVGSEFHALPISLPRDESPCWLCNRLRAPDRRTLQINSAEVDRISWDFDGVGTAFSAANRLQNPPISTNIHEYPPLQDISVPHTVCNCWNSISVMFDLRCSEFELFCSESAGQPQTRGSGGSKSSMIPNRKPKGGSMKSKKWKGWALS